MNLLFPKNIRLLLTAALLGCAPTLNWAQTTTIVDGYTLGDNGANGTEGSYKRIGGQVNVGSTSAPAITSLDFLMATNTNNPSVSPAPSVQVCQDSSGTPNISSCVSFNFTSTTNPLDPTGTIWAGNVYKNSYSGNFPITPNQNVWILATSDTSRHWLTTNWANSFGSYRMAFILDPNQPTNWSPFGNQNLGIPVSLYYTPSGSVTPAPDSASGVVGSPINPINVLSNDITDGQPATTANSIISVVTPASDPSVVLNPTTGLVTTTTSTPPGNYNITYQLCSSSTPTVCANTTVSITIAGSVNPIPDTGSGKTGTPITPINVLANDTSDGVPATLSNSAITVKTPATHAGVTLDPATGMVTTTATVPAGSYSITYELCDRATPAVCAEATVTVALEDPVKSPTSVPTIGAWGLFGLSIMLSIFGFSRVRKMKS